MANVQPEMKKSVWIEIRDLSTGRSSVGEKCIKISYFPSGNSPPPKQCGADLARASHCVSATLPFRSDSQAKVGQESKEQIPE